MATLMRCTMPHWQGNTFVDVGTVLPAGHSKAIPEFFDPYDVEDFDERTATEREADANAELGRLQVEAEKAGVKVDKRWGADRLRDEIAKAEAS